jgi:hypothetical protein
MTLSMTTLSKKTYFATLSINETQQNNNLLLFICDLFIVMLIVLAPYPKNDEVSGVFK